MKFPSQFTTSSYHITRVCLLRFSAFVFFFAFAMCRFQFEGLVGSDGLAPATVHLARVEARYPSRLRFPDDIWALENGCSLLTNNPASSSDQQQTNNKKKKQQQRSDEGKTTGVREIDVIYAPFDDYIEKAWWLVFQPPIVNAVNTASCAISKRWLLKTQKGDDEVGFPSWDAFKHARTLLWFVPFRRSGFEDHQENFDFWLVSMGGAGMLLSAFVLITGTANAVIIGAMFVLAESLFAVMQEFGSFGWYMQTCETLFLLIFCVPLLKLKRYDIVVVEDDDDGEHDEADDVQLVTKTKATTTRSNGIPVVPLLLLRLVEAKIMMGASLIKLRASECWWRDLSCMFWHYETQPNPHFTSIFFHAMPKGFHMFEVLVNHVVEFVAPFLIFAGCVVHRWFGIVGGVSVILFMTTIAASGNLAFLNHLSMIPAIACLPDSFFLSLASLRFCGIGAITRFLLSIPSTTALPPPPQPPLPEAEAQHQQQQQQASRKTKKPSSFFSIITTINIKFTMVRAFSVLLHKLLRITIHLALAVFVLSESRHVFANLLNPNMRMNSHFAWHQLVNTYGAFGSVHDQTTEYVFQGRRRDAPQQRQQQGGGNNNNNNNNWKTYRFRSRTSSVSRVPTFITPYHRQLDWSLWTPFQSHRTAWFHNLIFKMLRNNDKDKKLLRDLLLENPFDGGEEEEDGKSSATSSPSSSSSSSTRGKNNNTHKRPVEVRVYEVRYWMNIKKDFDDDNGDAKKTDKKKTKKKGNVGAARPPHRVPARSSSSMECIRHWWWLMMEGSEWDWRPVLELVAATKRCVEKKFLGGGGGGGATNGSDHQKERKTKNNNNSNNNNECDWWTREQIHKSKHITTLNLESLDAPIKQYVYGI